MEWVPRTRLGRAVKEGKIKSIDEILARGLKIPEPEIVDFFFPDLKTEFIFIGQAKGKFGGGKRRPMRRTQKKVREGARDKYTYLAVVGNGNGYVGIGKGSSRDPTLARKRAIENAKKNLIKVRRGCGDWECGCGTEHSLPFKVVGKSGSVRIILKPAPLGTGLVIGDEGKKILRLAGIKDVWSMSFGQTRTRINYAYAIFDALKKTAQFKLKEGA